MLMYVVVDLPEHGTNHISNVGYYTIPDGQGPSTRLRLGQSPNRAADPTKYQSPFVRRDHKRVSGRAKELYHEFVTPRNRNHTTLAQVIATPRWARRATWSESSTGRAKHSPRSHEVMFDIAEQRCWWVQTQNALFQVWCCWTAPGHTRKMPSARFYVALCVIYNIYASCKNLSFC